MTDQDQAAGQGVERGFAEDASGTPVTPTDVEASRRPPSEPDPTRIGDDDVSEGGDGGSGTSGPSDAA